MGILLALGRRSNMPVIKAFCVIFIEIIRGVPLVALLFMASVMLPLFMPPGTNFDKFLRALVGVSLFASAYMAEVIRGGLQAIPSGQYEGADSLGLSYWQKNFVHYHPANAENCASGDCEHVYRLVQRHKSCLHYRYVRPAWNRQAEFFGCHLGNTADTGDGSCFCRICILDFLFLYVALFAIYGKKAGYGPSVNRCGNRDGVLQGCTNTEMALLV
jgi:His/Glu/Gln/Arg/opine family amino acid ABC transporter permease subunit